MNKTSNTIVSIEDLSIGYGKKIIQKNINLTISKGQMVCLIGKNGCGKSTLLKTLAGIEKNISGNIFIQEKNTKYLSQEERAKIISLVLTERPQIPHSTVLDIIKMGQMPSLKWYQHFSKKNLSKINKAIKWVNIADKKERLFNQLSDGEQQKVMIAKSLAQDTPIILLDEPTAHLDLPNRVETMILLKKLAKETGKIIIVTTHELNLALQTADKIWLMTQNEIISEAPNKLIDNKNLNRIFDNNLYQLKFSQKGFNISLNHAEK